MVTVHASTALCPAGCDIPVAVVSDGHAWHVDVRHQLETVGPLPGD